MADDASAEAAHDPLRTPFCDLVGIDVPIVQTGMGWVSGARLTAATANAGGLGILASATMTVPELRRAVAEVTERAPGKPFGVNFRADQPDLPERLALIIDAGVRVASFATPPSADVVARLADAGLVSIPTIGAKVGKMLPSRLRQSAAIPPSPLRTSKRIWLQDSWKVDACCAAAAVARPVMNTAATAGQMVSNPSLLTISFSL